MESSGLSGLGLEVCNLTKHYGDLRAVNDLSLKVRPGQTVGFLGPNGAGKTTTMRAIVGMTAFDNGTIAWNGSTIDRAARRRIGYMPQERGLYARMRVREQITYFGRLAGLNDDQAEASASKWIERLDLEEKQTNTLQELSGGNQQRVQLAVALVHKPDLLILDEPFAGLDPIAAETMRSVLSEQTSNGVSVLLSSHQFDLVEDLCDKALIIVDGTMASEGPINELRASSPVRLLKVRWADPVEHWHPPVGTLVSFDNKSATVELSTDHDIEAQLAYAMSPGAVTEISLQPPDMEDVFASIVADFKGENQASNTRNSS